MPKKFLKDLAPVLTKHANDPDPEVRDAGCAALGAIMKCVGQKAMALFISDIMADKVKMNKVSEYCQKLRNL